MPRRRYPADDRARDAKAERRAREGQESRPSGRVWRPRRLRLPDPDDYGHPGSDVREHDEGPHPEHGVGAFGSRG